MNEEEGEWFGRHDHPLLNHVILENVFRYVRKRDLLACRGVNKKWNVLTIPFIRSKFTVGISRKFLTNWSDPETENRSIENFVAVFSKNELGIPFAKFRMEPFYTKDATGQEFLKLCGDTTTELHLYQHEANFRVEDVSEILRSMKKLEKLIISEYRYVVTYSGNVVELFPGSKPKLSSLKSFTLECHVPEGPYKNCPTFIEELITAADNISDLTVGDCSHPRPPPDGDENTPSNISRALSVIEKLGRESSIRRLTLYGVRMKPHVELLRRMAAKQNGLKLRKLSFVMDCEEESDHFQLVQLFKDTLEDLGKFGSSCSAFINFPKMPKLRCLDLEISRHFDSSLINLDKIFPHLEELELRQERHDRAYDEFLPQSEPCNKMKSLRFINGPHLTINAFNHVLTVFPKLTELKIDLQVDGAGILRQIWTQMRQLESLSLWGKLQTTDIDSLFCGSSTPTIKGVTGALAYIDKMSVELRSETILNLRNQHCQLPSIGNLTKLRRLTLNVSGRGVGNQLIYLSDVSGFLGFYSLKHLTHLVVHESKSLTKTCCEILAVEMEALESWEFRNLRGEAIIPHRT